jgi:hypothetical protein
LYAIRPLRSNITALRSEFCSFSIRYSFIVHRSAFCVLFILYSLFATRHSFIVAAFHTSYLDCSFPPAAGLKAALVTRHSFIAKLKT